MIKESAAMTYLIEELSDARMRCEQLKQYIQDAVGLIEKSKYRDHFFEVAGHLMQGIPQTLFKLDKALGATALAASKMDYDDLAQSLKPEKVDELERALNDSRIHYIQRRSEEGNMNSSQVSTTIRQIAKEAHETGRFPIRVASELVAALGGDACDLPIEHMPNTVPTAVLAAVADAVDEGAINSCAKIAQHVQHVVLSTLGQGMVAVLQQSGSREEVMDGFKKENPALTEEQLKEIADQWEKNKGNLKTASEDGAVLARKAKAYLMRQDYDFELYKGYSGRGMMGEKSICAFTTNARPDSPVGKYLRKMGFNSDNMGRDYIYYSETTEPRGSVTASDEEKLSRYEEGKPADPTENMSEEDAAKWKAQTEEHKNEFKTA